NDDVERRRAARSRLVGRKRGAGAENERQREEEPHADQLVTRNPTSSFTGSLPSAVAVISTASSPGGIGPSDSSMSLLSVRPAEFATVRSPMDWPERFSSFAVTVGAEVPGAYAGTRMKTRSVRLNSRAVVGNACGSDFSRWYSGTVRPR